MTRLRYCLRDDHGASVRVMESISLDIVAVINFVCLSLWVVWCKYTRHCIFWAANLNDG
jgi:hypothetical protein